MTNPASKLKDQAVLNLESRNLPVSASNSLVLPAQITSKRTIAPGFRKMTGQVSALALGLALSLGVCTAKSADAEREKFYFDIGANAVGEALKTFAIQTDSEILFTAAIVKNKNTQGLHGEYTYQEALQQILAGTGLSVEKNDEKVFLIHASNQLVGPENLQDESKPREDEQEDVKKKPLEAQWIEEITVTASKRAKSIQETAMSVTALSGEDIDRKGLVSMEDYLNTIPGVSQVDRGVGRNSVVIRGVTADPNFGSPTVGIYFGEIPLTGLAYFGSADVKLVDMERVEVLRGPQGTLYGASSLSGTVRNIPVAPNLQEWEGSIEVGYSEMAKEGNDSNSVVGVINIPLIEDTLAVRASVYQFENSGYISNVAGSDPAQSALAALWGVPELAVDEDNVGSSEYTGGRIGVLWEPTNKASMQLTYLTQDLEQDGIPSVSLDLGDYEQAHLQLAALSGGSEGLVDDIDVTNLIISYDLGWAEITSSSSWLEEFARRNTDLTTIRPSAPEPQIPGRDSESFVEELRLTSNLDGPINFIAGLYYEDIERVLDVDIFYGGDPALNPFSDLLLFHQVLKDDLEQKAIFGELTYDINNKLSFTLGGRYFDYEKGQSNLLMGAFAGLPSGVTNQASFKSTETGDNIKANVTFEPNDDSLFYMQWSEGFRLGGPMQKLPASTCDVDSDGIIDGTNAPIDLDSIDSDILESFEIGGKITALNGRLVLNGTLYQNNWEGIPVFVSTDCAFPLTVNAGEAKTKGVEVESTFYLTQDLKVDVGASFTDAELTKDVASLNAQNGDRLPASPRYNMSIALQYDFDVKGYPTYARVDVSRVGSYYGNIGEVGPKLGGYNQINLQAGISANNISAELYVKNMANADQLTWWSDLFNAGYRLRPRTIGLGLRYKF